MHNDAKTPLDALTGYLADHDPDNLMMLSPRALARACGRDSVDDEVLSAAGTLVDRGVLAKGYMLFDDDGETEWEISPDEVREAEGGAPLFHPEYGDEVTDWMDRVFPYYYLAGR